MTAFAVRAILSGIIIALIAVIGRKAPAAGALIASLPLISVVGMFWYVLPSLPMFLLLPWLLRSGFNFWFALSSGIALTLLLYLVTIVIAARFGVRL